MRRYPVLIPSCFFAFVLGLLPALPLSAQSGGGEAESWTPELALQVKRVSAVRVSPDGTRTALVVAEAVMDAEKSEWLSHIHVGMTDGSGSFQLTRGEKSALSPAWSPDGEWIVFISSRGGDRPNLWRIRADGGEAERLTDEKGGISTPLWSPDGSQIAFLMSAEETEEEKKAKAEKRDAWVLDENIKMTDLYVVPAGKNSGEERPVRKLTRSEFNVGGAFGAGLPNWSPDGKRIAFGHVPTPKVNDWTKADISVVDVGSGEVRLLVATEAAEGQPFFSPDGKWIAYSASDNPPTWGFAGRVHVVAADGGEPRPLAESYDRQPEIVGWASDGGSLFISETHRTVNRLSSVPVDGGTPVEVSPADLMVDGPHLNSTGTFLGFTSQAADAPPEAYASPIERFSPVQVSRVQELPALPLGRTEVIEWTSSDGKSVEGLLTYPVDYRPRTPVPLLVVVHGGPTGVFTQRFIAQRGAYPIAAFASKGYAVLRCNVRGSSGYGRDFRYANYQDWGGGDYRDIMSGVDRLIEQGSTRGNHTESGSRSSSSMP